MSKKTSAMNVRNIKKKILQMGWSEERITGGHAIYKHSFRMDKIVIPMHRGDLNIGVARRILKQLDNNLYIF